MLNKIAICSTFLSQIVAVGAEAYSIFDDYSQINWTDVTKERAAYDYYRFDDNTQENSDETGLGLNIYLARLREYGYKWMLGIVIAPDKETADQMLDGLKSQLDKMSRADADWLCRIYEEEVDPVRLQTILQKNTEPVVSISQPSILDKYFS